MDLPIKYVPFLFLLSVMPCGAQQDTFNACANKAKTQAELNSCANAELTRATAKLGEVYRNLLSEAEAEAPGAATKVKAAESAWIAYRNAYVEAMFPAKDKQAEYGSKFPMDEALLRGTLTLEHAEALQRVLDAYRTGMR
jgi:uncharacterized protein YecT (DUF1311 family)